MKRGATSVDRLTDNLNAAEKEWQNAYKRLWGPRALGGFAMAMTTNPNIRRNWQAAINRAAQRRENIKERLRAANKNALQVQYLKMNNRGFEIVQRLGNISRQLNTIPRNNASRRVPLALEYKALRREQNKLITNRDRLRKAINLRKKVLARKMTPQRAEQTVARSLRPLMLKVLYGPYGTRTIEAHKRAPGYTPPTLENYARVRRELNRTRQALRR